MRGDGVLVSALLHVAETVVVVSTLVSRRIAREELEEAVVDFSCSLTCFATKPPTMFRAK